MGEINIIDVLLYRDKYTTIYFCIPFQILFINGNSSISKLCLQFIGVSINLSILEQFSHRAHGYVS